MKKIMVSFMILLLIFSSPVLAVKEDKQWDKVCYKTITEWLEGFKGDDVSEEKRIVDFQVGSYGTLGEVEKEDIHTKVIFQFRVTPYSEEKTTWKVGRPNLCFAEFEIVNGEYVLKSIYETPKDYDKFLERFEEYKKNNENLETTEIREVQAIQETNLASEKITQMSHTIFITCLLVFVGTVCMMLRKMLKRKK